MSNGFTAADLKKFKREVEKTAVKKINAAKSHTDPASTNLRVTHLCFVTYNESGHRLLSSKPPAPRAYQYSTESRTGNIYSLNMEGIFHEAILGKETSNFREIRDPESNDIVEYEMDCTVGHSKFSSAKGTRDVGEYLRENLEAAYDDDSEMDSKLRANIKMLMDETGKLRESIQHRLGFNERIYCPVSSFEQRVLTSNITKNDAFGNAAVRTGVECIVKDVEPRIYVQVKQSTDDNGIIQERLLIGKPEFKAKALEPRSSEFLPSVAEMFEPLATKSGRFCRPIADVLNGTAEIPREIVFHLKHAACLYDDRILRFILQFKNPEPRTFHKQDEGIRRPWLVEDKYLNDDGTTSKYDLSFNAWPDTCGAIGIDQQFWFQLMSTNQTLECFIFAQYDRNQTLALECNQPYQVATKTAEDSAGMYEFKVTRLFPNYRSWFEEGNGIELSAEQTLQLFTAGRKRGYTNFSSSVTEEEEKIVIFKSVLDVPNPLHESGLKSEVICLGSVPRPVFDCSDAAELFDPHQMHRFFAMVDDPMTKTAEDFIKKASREEICYQIFVVTNQTVTTKTKYV